MSNTQPTLQINETLLISFSMHYMVTHCDAWNHRIDATKTASLSNFQIRLRDCTDQLSRRFSDGDLRSSPDLRGDSPRRRKFNTSCQFCDGCTRQRTVPDVDTDKLSVQINPLKSDTPQVLAESYNELDTPQVSAESYNELDTPQVSAESYKELDTPQVSAESYNKPDHNSELTNRLKVIALEETMARSRDATFDDTPDHLYGRCYNWHPNQCFSYSPFCSQSFELHPLRKLKANKPLTPTSVNLQPIVSIFNSADKSLRWLPPVLHFPEPLNFTKGFPAHHDGLV